MFILGSERVARHSCFWPVLAPSPCCRTRLTFPSVTALPNTEKPLSLRSSPVPRSVCVPVRAGHKLSEYKDSKRGLVIARQRRRSGNLVLQKQGPWSGSVLLFNHLSINDFTPLFSTLCGAGFGQNHFSLTFHRMMGSKKQQRTGPLNTRKATKGCNLRFTSSYYTP